MHEENTSKWGIGNDSNCLYMKLEELLKESLGLELVKNNQCSLFKLKSCSALRWKWKDAAQVMAS